MIAPDIIRWSPNVNRDGNGVPLRLNARTVIIHATRSGKSMNPTEFIGTLNYMATPGTVSSQWVIARDGRAARCVPDDQQAWHAGEDNDNAFGIELEQGAEQDGFTAPQIDKLVAVCKGYMVDFGVAPVHATSSTMSGFIGHQETAQGQRSGKSDPGAGFPWDAFMNALTGSVAPTAAQVGHALSYAYTAYFEGNPNKLHPFDKRVIEYVAKWLRTG